MIEPSYHEPLVDLYVGHVLDVLAALPEGRVQCVVTSPPYWGLRDYSLEPQIWGGVAGCAHVWEAYIRIVEQRDGKGIGRGIGETFANGNPRQTHPEAFTKQDIGGAFCVHCQAWRGSLGLEPVPFCAAAMQGQACADQCYLGHILQVADGLWRVLRDDGTLWWNHGDGYNTAAWGDNTTSFADPKRGKTAAIYSGGMQSRYRTMKTVVLKPKDLMGMPWRVAFALQARGWYLRSEIIWHKPNPMPESVSDRPTRSHEQVFLLSKRPTYYYDAEAVREPVTETTQSRDQYARAHPRGWHTDAVPINGGSRDDGAVRSSPAGRNLRSVWTIATHPFPDAHFATFPPALVEPCIKAGSSEQGCCGVCGAPWRRVVARGGYDGAGRADGSVYTGRAYARLQSSPRGPNRNFGEPWSHTRGWRASCAHDVPAVPCTVLDPFMGSGTVALVSRTHGRRSLGIELSEPYLTLAMKRLRQQELPWHVERVESNGTSQS